MNYAIKPVKMQDTHAIRYDIWDLEADEPIVQTFNAQEAKRICDELNKTSSDLAGRETADSALAKRLLTRPTTNEMGHSLGDNAGRTGATIAEGSTPSPLISDFATRKNEVLSPPQANLLASSPGRDYLKDEECPLASLPHWQQGMALALLGRQKAREWAISKRFGGSIWRHVV